MAAALLNKQKKTWLITGASSGLGSAIASAALDAGHTVVGTTRDVKKAEEAFPDFTKRNGTWNSLDPGNASASERVAQISREYSIDVVVNAAGFALHGGVEDTSEDEVRAQMEVNFYGPLRVVKALLPSMRERRSGHIILISSAASFIARAGRSSYAASKIAIEAVHESLSHELQPFGIKVLIVEPGAFRTPFALRLKTPAGLPNGFSDGYRGTEVEQMITTMRGITDIAEFCKGDPNKAAKAIVNAVEGGHEYLRLPLGNDSVAVLETHIGELQSDLDATRSVASATDVD